MSPNSENGFTLIEFLVAIVIMMVGLLGLLQAVNVSIQHNLNSQLRIEAVSVADENMSRELAKSFDSVSTSARGTVVRREVLKSFKNYSVIRSGSTLSNSKQINLTVSWRHKGVRNTHDSSSVVSKHQ